MEIAVDGQGPKIYNADLILSFVAERSRIVDFLRDVRCHVGGEVLRQCG